MLIVSHMLIAAHCITSRILMSELISLREVEPILSRPHRRGHRLERRPILRAIWAARGRACRARRNLYAAAHREIVERFGRLPHRNGILGRETTPEEAEYLKTEGSSF
jgi:hypothetical protein